MAGTKRRRGSSKSAPGTALSAAAAPAGSSPSSSSAVFRTLRRLVEISESRAEETLQAFCDGKCWIDSSTKKSSTPNWDTYWVVLGTHMVNRLVMQEESAVILSAFCDALSKILVSDKGKLEKASHSASSRSILARAILTTTVASLICVKHRGDGNADAFQAAVASLDRLIHLKPDGTNDDNDSDTKTAATTNTENTLSNKWIHDLDDPEEEFCIQRVQGEDDCVACLEEAGENTKASAAPPAKRARTRRKSASTNAAAAPDTTSPGKAAYDMTALHQALESIMEDSSQRIDGRVAVKRWAGMALVWLCQGQIEILQIVHKLAEAMAASASTTSPGNYFVQLTPQQTLHNTNRLIMIAAEAGNHAGLRPPTGGMDQYLRSIAVSQPKKSKFTRADIRDLASVCIGDLVQLHRQYLESLSPKAVVNDQEDAEIPDLPATLTNLCRAAASSVSNSTFSEQGEWTKTLLSIAAAKCLQLTTDPKLPLDCKLTNFALSHLEESLRNLEQHGTTSASAAASGAAFSSEDDDEARMIEQLFSLREPLPSPEETPSSGDNTNSNEPTFLNRRRCNFGGMLPQSFPSEFDSEQAVALAIRALQPSKEPPVVKLVMTLTDIIRRAYDTRKAKDDGDTKKRAKNPPRRTKRRKTEEPAPTESGEWQRITAPRALVISEALNALRQCLTTTTASILSKSIRKTLTGDQFEEIIRLSEYLDLVILKTRHEPVKVEVTENDPPSPGADVSFFTSSGANTPSSNVADYTHWEKLLWTAHISLCQVLGRGKASFDGNVMPTPLITRPDRKRIYKAIASAHRNCHGSEWPLSLPAPYHAFLVANLTCEPINPDGCEPELYIAKECVKSIHHVLMNPKVLDVKEYESDQLYLDDEIPFSHRDARTFLLAVSRLSTVHQRKCLDDLVRASLAAFMSMQHGDDRSDFLRGKEASGFAARVLVVCTALVDIINHGSSLRETFFTSAGPATLPLPSYTNNSEWYRCDRCFMGLFADWESPALPELSRPSTGVISVKESTMGELQLVLESAFCVGFETARNDHCHLLFAAWNGLGKIHQKTRTTLSLTGTNFPTFQANGSEFAKQILQMRDDVCSIQKDINEGVERAMPSASSRLKLNLSLMLRRANTSLNSILQRCVTNDNEMTQEIDTALFSLLSAIPTYISSSIAGHTKPGNDYFSTTLSKGSTRKPKRQRGYSSGSDPTHSDADSVETDGGGYDSDVRVDVLSRLRECCDAFGAAPIHPDWLDVSCSLREGFTVNDAIESAECALSVLNKLVTVAFREFKKHYLEALKAYHTPDESLDSRLHLCLNLCQFSSHESAATSVLGPGPYPDDREWKDDTASACGLNQDVLDLFFDESVVCNVESARESWCPNAAQRLIGKLQDRNRLIGGWETSTAELRAGGEWELLISEALSLPCLDVKEFSVETSESKVEMDEESIQRGSDLLRTAFLWRSVLLNATSHLMPAAALLRLGLNNKIGRKPHPFSFHENNQDPYDVAPLQFSERLSGSNTVSSSLKNVVYETLTLLARLSAEGDDTLSTTCHAISAHLVVDTASFCDLEGLQSIRFAFMALKRIRIILETTKKKESSEVIPFIVERLSAVIEDFGRSPRNKISSTVESSEEFQRLLAFFGAPGIRRADCVVESSVELFDILNAKCIKELDEDSIGSYVWSNKARQSEAITELVAALSANILQANDRTRSCLALLLSHLADLESHPTFDAPKPGFSPIIVPAIIDSFNSIDIKLLKQLVLNDLCCLKPPPKPDQSDSAPTTNLRSDLSTLFGFLLSTNGHSARFKRSRSILDMLLDAFDEWSVLEYKYSEPVLNVLFLYGCRFNRLDEIGTKLLARATSSKEADQTIGTDAIKTVSKFFSFVRALSSALDTNSVDKKKKKSMANESDPKNETNPGGTNSDQDTSTQHPKSCSFAQKSGFRAQHWYNCYSCQLVWDKGCCTLCAMVCHRGHDVSYSRYSSFFCDCGAEDGNVTEQTRVSCRCLKPLPADQIEKIFKNEETEGGAEPSNGKGSNSHDSSSRENDDSFNHVGAEIARDSFRDEALASIKGFRGNVQNSPWLDSLLTILRQQFQIWKDSRSPKSDLEVLLKESTKGDDSRPIVRVPHHMLRTNLRSRRAKILDLQRLGEKSLIPVRAAKGFQLRMSSDTSSNAHLSAQLSRHETTRSIIATDSRGRMVIAEPCSLVFCSAIPAVSVRHVNRPYETPLSRHQMCILGASPVRFHIVGLQTCSENERHLVVWGRSEACVAILKQNWNGVEETIDLVFDLEHHEGEGDHLVKCEWIPGSQTHLAVGCSRFVRIYDITKSDGEKRALPVIGYNLGFEASLRDVTIVPYKGGENEESARLGVVSKMFLLLENGRLHVVDLKTASGGRLESPGDQHFEPSECISLSTAGVRQRIGSSVGQTGASTTTLGEGSKLAYLKQSRVLLYKCVSSCVLAIMLDSKGDSEGTFELVPHTISSDLLGNGPDGYSVTGPFTHWTELGVVYREGASFFRVACVGKSSKSSKPKLLCIEFNENDVRIKEMAWLSGSGMGLGLGLNMSFEGLAAFSVPFVSGTSEKRVLSERAYLCAVTSNGSMLFFGDESVDTITYQKDDGTSNKSLRPVSIINLSGIAAMQSKKPTFPLTRFETLKNISDSEAVVFGGEGTGSDQADLKSRLSRDSTSSFLCPRREGCTITITLTPPKTTNAPPPKTPNVESSHQQMQSPPSDPVIAALRVLVGSTSNYIPSKIHVQGRPVDLTPRVKKWYCLPLTDEEIALSLRNGFVTVGIGPSFDSSTSVVVDSIEVYATERKAVEAWLPKQYFHKVAGSQSDLYTAVQLSSNVSAGSRAVDSHGLVLSVQALTDLCELVGSNKLIAEGEREFLRRLIQDTALDRDKKVSECVHSLLESLEPDSRSRKSFYDESILFGCSRALQNARDVFDCESSQRESEEASNGSQKWTAVRAVVQDCLEAASSIARERPMNYLQSMQNIVESKMSSGSIAVDASNLILKGLQHETLYEDLIGGLGGIVDLSLTEMAIELNTDAPHSKQFAKFDVIRGLLECSKPLVVEKCCEAIASFCRKHGGAERSQNYVPDLFTLLQHARVVAYQCDSCGLCPMKEIRYTLLEEDYDIDLCKDCFRLGKEFAESQGFDPQVPVVVNQKTVGGETKLTCIQMKQMQPVSLEKIDVEQVEVKSSVRQGNSPEASPEEDEDLQKALRLSLGETASDENETSDLPMGHQAYEYFVGHLFTSVVELLSSVLKRERCNTNVGPLIRLLLDLVRNSKQPDSQNERAKRFSKELSQGISHILKSGSAGKKIPQERFLVLVKCLRSFTNLLVPETDSSYFLEGSHPDEHAEESRAVKPKEKTTPKFICEVHNIPAVRRRCARGVHKDRRFYVCGKERGQRCKYFIWADEVESKTDHKPKIKSNFDEFIRGFFWGHTASSMPLHARLCRLLEDEVLGDDPEDCEVSLSVTNSAPDEKKTEKTTRKSHYDVKDMERDLADGVYCCREKMQDVASGVDLVKAVQDSAREMHVPAQTPTDRSVMLLEASLDLLTLIADHRTEGISRWFSLLCEINISSNKSAGLRNLAKRVLKTLCGGNKNLYHSVRDHFAFGFQLRNLYRNASTALEAALIVKEKARQCSENWSSTKEVTWKDLRVDGLIGTEELISEDSYTQICSKKLGKVLDELWSVIKNRGESWRRFCGLRSLPHSHRENIGIRSEVCEGEKYLSAAPPVWALFWMASALPGSNQVKILRLLDFALTNWKERKAGQNKSHDSSSDEEGCHDNNGADDAMPIASEPSQLPEDILVGGDSKITVEGIVAFAMATVFGGRSVELRKVAYHVLVKVCDRLSSTERGLVFQRLIGSPLANAGMMGKTCVEFLHLLQSLCKSLDSSVPVKDAASFIMQCFIDQMTAVKYDRSNGQWFVLETGSGVSALKRKFDLSECSYCVRPHHFSAKDGTHKRENGGRAGARGNGAPAGTSSSQARASSAGSRSQPNKKWHPDQICAFTRSNLDSLKDGSASNEFSSFFTLKHRAVISEIDLTVNDPRGRYVKTVTVYSSPRPVDDVSELKSDRYGVKWQRCATLSLSRGATRATTTLSHLMVAANLKVEFSDFYERPGGSKASDGSLLVHCPRCTRVVTNAHGVCGNCGEVAFQCRKCRHINYDRLDAFLCVECGYCASGSFSFELNYGVASNAVAITNDKDYDNNAKILSTTTAIHEQLRTALREKLRLANTRKKSGSKKEDASNSFSPALQRAFLGLPPISEQDDTENVLTRIDKQGSVVKYVARPDSIQPNNRASAAVDRTRSLLRLARQIRSESASASDRRRGPGDVIIRHLGRGLAIDNLDDENDLIGLLEGGSILDSSEPLSRVIASVQSRRRAESGRSSAQGRRPTDNTASAKKIESGKETFEECQRLHSLMREAERECSELSRRIQAWNRLDSGCIVDTIGCAPVSSLSYTPSHCSSCGAAVALQLLLLWSRLFLSDPNSILIDQTFLTILLEEIPNVSRALMDCKRQVVQEIATKSSVGAKMVLVELRKRLSATNDIASADILGKILEVEGFELSDDYAKLAMDVLAGRRNIP